MKPSAIALALVVPVVFCGSGAIAASKDAATTEAKAPTKAAAKKAPDVSATLDKSSYATGATMTLTVSENLFAKSTIKVADSSGTDGRRSRPPRRRRRTPRRPRARAAPSPSP